MEPSEAIEQLPAAYAEALRLQQAGREDHISARLEIPPEAVGPLLRLAHAKLAALLDSDQARCLSGSEAGRQGRGRAGGVPRPDRW